MKKPIRRSWTPEKVADRIRAGYGQGVLADYLPWIGVRDLSSMGTSTRMWSPKTGRKMEFLSNIERDTFLIAEFRDDFVDYWEQWPLDRNWTLSAAQQLGYRHPIYVGSTTPVVMTVDAALTYRHGAGVRRIAIDCKHSQGLDDERTKQKLAIARLACESVSLPHILTTEHAARRQLVHNILWVRMALPRSGEKVPTPGAFDIWPMHLHKRLLKSRADGTEQSMTLSAYANWLEHSSGLPTGLGLRCMKLLIWQQLVAIDMEAAHPERMLIASLQVNPIASFAQPWMATCKQAPSSAKSDLDE